LYFKVVRAFLKISQSSNNSNFKKKAVGALVANFFIVSMQLAALDYDRYTPINIKMTKMYGKTSVAHASIPVTTD